jgi:O-antigen/teichoic acid export membrane protein
VSIIPAIHKLIARYRKSLKTIVLRGLTQAVGTGAPLIVLAGQGAGAFGLFSVLIAVAGLSVVLEWGLPLQLQNEISRGNTPRLHNARWFIRESGFVFHLCLNLAFAFGLWFSSPLWIHTLFPADVSDAITQQNGALLAIFLVAAATASCYHGSSLVFGLGHIETYFTIGFLASLVTLFFVLVGVYAGFSTAVLAVMVSANPLLGRLFAAVYCFYRRHPLARHPSMPPPLAGQEPPFRRRSVALMFLYLQLLALVASNIDSIWAARANSLQSVGEYAFLLKLYGIPLMVANILSSASMPRLAIESHRGDGRHIVFELLRSNILLMLSVGLAIFFASSLLFRLISGTAVDLRPLAALMLLDNALLALRSVFTVYINAAELLWLNVMGNTLYAIVVIGLKLIFSETYGIYGLVSANIVAYILFLMPFHLLAFRRGTLGARGEVQ